MTQRDPAELPAAVEALLTAWPVPERSDEAWAASAAAIAARLRGAAEAVAREGAGADASTPGTDAPKLDDAALLAEPLPREADEPEVFAADRCSSPRLAAAATPRPLPTATAERSLAQLARSRVAESDRERRLEVARQSLDHVARARSRGEFADQVARTAEARSGDRSSQPSLPARRDRLGMSTLFAAMGMLAAAASILVLVQVVRRSPPKSVEPVVVAASSAKPSPPATSPAADEEPVARLEDLPANADRASPGTAPRPSRPSAGAATAPRLAVGTAVASAAPAEPDEFDTKLQHAEGRSTPLAPTTGEAIAALAPGLGQAKRCVTGHTEPSVAVITFSSDGTVSSVAVSGPAAGTPAGSCIESAFKGARVVPFAKPSFTVSYPVRP